MKRPKKGYGTYVSDDSIREHLRRPLLDKLRLLEEMLRFNAAFLSPTARRFHELFRRGAL